MAVRRLRRRLRRRPDSRRRFRHRRGGRAAARREARGRGRNRSRDHAPRPRAASRSALLRPARHARQRRRASLPPNDDEEVRPRGVRVDRLADDAIELLGRAARELHVHHGVVQGCAGSSEAGRPARGLQLLPRAMAGRSARQHGGGGVRSGAAGTRARSARVPRRHARRPAAGDA